MRRSQAPHRHRTTLAVLRGGRAAQRPHGRLPRAQRPDRLRAPARTRARGAARARTRSTIALMAGSPPRLRPLHAPQLHDDRRRSRRTPPARAPSPARPTRPAAIASPSTPARRCDPRERRIRLPPPPAPDRRRRRARLVVPTGRRIASTGIAPGGAADLYVLNLATRHLAPSHHRRRPSSAGAVRRNRIAS